MTQRLTLTIVRGEPLGATHEVATGEERLLGRLPPSTIVVGGDPFVSGRHAVIVGESDGFALRDLSSASGTFLNERRIATTRLLDGDEVRVGETSFRVAIAQLAAPPAAATGDAAAASTRPAIESSTEPNDEPSPDEPDESAPQDDPFTADLPQDRGYRGDDAADVAERFAIADDFPAVAEAAAPGRAADMVVAHLAELGELPAAIRLLGHALPRRLAVSWAIRAVLDNAGDALSAADREYLTHCERWTRDPTDAHRRAAFEPALESNDQSLGALAALAVGMADGSLAPDGMGHAPAPPKQVGLIVSGLVEAACLLNPEHAPQRRLAAIEHGTKLARDGFDAPLLT